MTEARVGREYNRWLGSRSPWARAYALLTTVPGMVLVNTPAFRFDISLKLKPEQRLLDVGCGPGSLLEVLAARTSFDKPPVGVDLSMEMLRRGMHRETIELLNAAASALPFSNNTFDVALSAYMIKHLNDYELLRFLQELWRVLKPGGFAVVWEFRESGSKWRDRLSRWLLTRGIRECTLRDYEQIVALAAHAGFEWAGNARLRPFLYPPIPRVSVILGKASQG